MHIVPPHIEPNDKQASQISDVYANPYTPSPQHC
jgi:hypothetical protein